MLSNRVYIEQGSDKEWLNANCFNAFEGFTHLGFEIIPFRELALIDQDLNPGDIVFGCTSQVHTAFRVLGIRRPDPVDYPKDLGDYLGRWVEPSTLGELLRKYEQASPWALPPIFVKPRHPKIFSGEVVISGARVGELVKEFGEDREILTTGCVQFETEYRCFVLRGELIDARYYEGDFRKIVDFGVVEAAIEDYTSAPGAYSLDFGLTPQGETLLVEANDFYCCGSYGLCPKDYATMISERWTELYQQNL